MNLPQHNEPLPSIHANEINGIDCPACGHPTLMLMSGGYITCCLLDCPNPDFADAYSKEQTRLKSEERGNIHAARLAELYGATGAIAKSFKLEEASNRIMKRISELETPRKGDIR